MAFKPVYLEPDEEITSVIDKISSATDSEIALVTAKNSGIFQSLVNLKLLAKESKKLKKNIIIVTSSKVGQRLAKQVGIDTFSTLAALPAVSDAPASGSNEAPAATPSKPDEVINGVQVKQYNPDRPSSEVVEGDKDSDAAPVSKEADSPGSAEPSETAQEFKPVTINPDNLEKKQTSTDKKPVDGDEASKDELPAVASSSKGFSVAKEFKVPWKSVGIGSGILVALLLLAFVFVPRAVVKITFPAQPIKETVSISAVANLENQEKGLIAGNKLSVEKTKTETIVATGKKDIGTKASGTISITNKYVDGSGTGKDQTFTAGAKATDTKTSKVFTLNNSVTVGKVTYDPNNGQPIYKTNTVSVTATEPGESYNIPAGSFTIASALSNTLISSSESFTGGLTKQVTVLTQDDVDTAILKIKKEARDEAVSEIEEKAQGQKLLSDGIWETLKQEGVDKEVGAQTEEAIATVVVEYGSLAFDEGAATAIFTSTFDNKINETEQIVFPEESKPTFTTKEISEDRNRLNFDISGTAFKVPKIDNKQVAGSVTGESSQGAEGVIKDKYGAESVETKINPGWWIDKLPLIKGFIKIEYGFNEVVPAVEGGESSS